MTSTGSMNGKTLFFKKNGNVARIAIIVISIMNFLSLFFSRICSHSLFVCSYSSPSGKQALLRKVPFQHFACQPPNAFDLGQIVQLFPMNCDCQFMKAGQERGKNIWAVDIWERLHAQWPKRLQGYIINVKDAMADSTHSHFSFVSQKQSAKSMNVKAEKWIHMNHHWEVIGVKDMQGQILLPLYWSQGLYKFPQERLPESKNHLWIRKTHDI